MSVASVLAKASCIGQGHCVCCLAWRRLGHREGSQLAVLAGRVELEAPSCSTVICVNWCVFFRFVMSISSLILRVDEMNWVRVPITEAWIKQRYPSTKLEGWKSLPLST